MGILDMKHRHWDRPLPRRKWVRSGIHQNDFRIYPKHPTDENSAYYKAGVAIGFLIIGLVCALVFTG